MALNRQVANDMALDKLALPAISDTDVLDILRTWEFQSYDCCFVPQLLTAFDPEKPPKFSPGTCLCMLLKKTFSRHSPISWELQPMPLGASLLQVLLSSNQLSSVCLHAGSRTICPSLSFSPSHLPASPQLAGAVRPSNIFVS